MFMYFDLHLLLVNSFDIRITLRYFSSLDSNTIGDILEVVRQ